MSKPLRRKHTVPSDFIPTMYRKWCLDGEHRESAISSLRDTLFLQEHDTTIYDQFIDHMTKFEPEKIYDCLTFLMYIVKNIDTGAIEIFNSKLEYTMPSQDIIEILANKMKTSKVLSVDSNSGLWELFLKHKGVNILACGSGNLFLDREHYLTLSFTEAIEKHPDRDTLFLHETYNGSYSLRCMYEKRWHTIIYIQNFGYEEFRDEYYIPDHYSYRNTKYKTEYGDEFTIHEMKIS